MAGLHVIRGAVIGCRTCSRRLEVSTCLTGRRRRSLSLQFFPSFGLRICHSVPQFPSLARCTRYRVRSIEILQSYTTDEYQQSLQHSNQFEVAIELFFFAGVVLMHARAPPAAFRPVCADLVSLVLLHWAPGPSVELDAALPACTVFFGSYQNNQPPPHPLPGAFNDRTWSSSVSNTATFIFFTLEGVVARMLLQAFSGDRLETGQRQHTKAVKDPGRKRHWQIHSQREVLSKGSCDLAPTADGEKLAPSFAKWLWTRTSVQHAISGISNLGRQIWLEQTDTTSSLPIAHRPHPTVLCILVCEQRRRKMPVARAHRCQFWDRLSPQANLR